MGPYDALCIIGQRAHQEVEVQKPCEPFGKHGCDFQPSHAGFLYKHIYVLLGGKNASRFNLIFKSVVIKIPAAAYMVLLYQFPKQYFRPGIYPVSASITE